MGFALIEEEGEDALLSELIAEPRLLGNEKLRVEFGDDGAIVSLRQRVRAPSRGIECQPADGLRRRWRRLGLSGLVP